MASNRSKTGYVIGGVAAAAAAVTGAYILTRPKTTTVTPPPSSSVTPSVSYNGVLSANASTVVVGQSVVVAVNITNASTGSPVSGVPVVIVENTTSTEGTVITNSNGVGSLSVSFDGTGAYSFIGSFS